MISEGSCDTEDWSNDAENAAAHHMNKLHLKIYSDRKKENIFQNITVFTVFFGEHKRILFLFPRITIDNTC